VLAGLASNLARAEPSLSPARRGGAPVGRAGEAGRRVERTTADVKEAARKMVVRRVAVALDASATPAGPARLAMQE
jgi:hypothetical protein